MYFWKPILVARIVKLAAKSTIIQATLELL